jgi:1-acyl-sn-glycerol-3-phosphate acyltransferase
LVIQSNKGKPKLRAIFGHIISCISLTAITINLLIWIPFLVLFAILNLIPIAAFQQRCYQCTARFYRLAAGGNTLWLTKILKIDFRIHGDLPGISRRPLIVVSNHTSWFDILLLQAVVVPGGPILKFLIKSTLIYVPVVGWICLALRFPRLTRGGSLSKNRKDFKAVTQVAQQTSSQADALLNFAEGTRFTEEKRVLQKSPYQHLLAPKSGGFKTMLNSMGDARVLDVTVGYPIDGDNFWTCLSGSVRKIEVWLEYTDASELGNSKLWLEARWQEKERQLESLLSVPR